MITSYSSAFPSPELTKILPGELLVGVPLSDGIIKTLATSESESNQFVICKETVGKVVIKLANNRPFHAVLEIPEDADGVLTSDRVQVFQQPIDELRLDSIKMPSGEEYWTASGFDLSHPGVSKQVSIVWTPVTK